MFINKLRRRISNSKPLLKIWSISLKKDFCRAGLLKDYCWSKIEPSFIVSTGRTGTKFLATFFNRYCKDTLSLHEPSPTMFYLGTDFIKGNISFREASNGFDIQRLHICRRLNKNNIRFYIESNGYLSSLIPVINVFYNNAKFVYIIRNGKDYVRSYYSKRPSNKGYYALSDESPMKGINSNDFLDDRFYGQWDNMSRFERVCWIWVKRNQMIESSLTEDISWIKVRFEDIFSNGCTGLWEIIDFLDLRNQIKIDSSETVKILADALNINKKYLLPKNFKDWPDDKKDIFEEICGEYMEKSGYR